MRLFTFLAWCLDGCPLHFGGGASPPPPPPPVALQKADPQGAADKSNMDAKRRIGGQDAVNGGILASLAKQNKGLSPTLGGNAPSYTGEA